MKKLWLAKIFFALGVFAFVVKPFYGFAMMAKHHHPAKTSILVKIFSKRGTDFQDEINFGISDFDKKSPHPAFKFVPYIGGLPHYIFASGILPGPTCMAFVKERKLNLFKPTPAWLLNGQLII